MKKLFYIFFFFVKHKIIFFLEQQARIFSPFLKNILTKIFSPPLLVRKNPIGCLGPHNAQCALCGPEVVCECDVLHSVGLARFAGYPTKPVEVLILTKEQ